MKKFLEALLVIFVIIPYYYGEKFFDRHIKPFFNKIRGD
jgi:hypothetical protein